MQSIQQLLTHPHIHAHVRFIDGRRLVSSSGDESAIIWDVERGQAVAKCMGHEGNVNSVAASADGALLVTGACDKTAKVWDVRDVSKPIRTFARHKGDINAVVFYPGGSAVGQYAIPICIPPSLARVTHPALCSATASDDSTGKLFDLRVTKCIQSFGDPQLTSPATSIAFSKSGRVLYLGHDEPVCGA